jgi:hypothetical protein
VLSIVSGSNGLWEYPMFAAHVRDHGYDLVLDPPLRYHAVWEKFPELLLIEAKFMAQLHDELFHLVDVDELRYSVSGLHTASSYLEQCVVGYATTTQKPPPSEKALQELQTGVWSNWHMLQEMRRKQHDSEYLPFACIASSPLLHLHDHLAYCQS